MYTKVCIICPIHGEFEQIPNNHINAKKGCSKCGVIKRWEKRDRMSTNKFIQIASELHKNEDGTPKYDYSKVNCTTVKDFVKIICPIHGEFIQQVTKHLDRMQGCPKCGIVQRSKKRKFTKEEFIKKASELHKNEDGTPKYDYSKFVYYNSMTKSTIICPIHGEFEKTPNKHIIMKQGCPECAKLINVKENQLLESIKNKYSNYTIIHNYRNKKLLNNQSLDIFIKELNIGVEYQGKQHFSHVKLFGDENHFQKTIELDKIKYQICKKNNIILLYFTYQKRDIPKDGYIDKIYTNENELFKIIDEIIKKKG